MPRPLLAISACLLGQPVRYDGGHKAHQWIIHELSTLVEWLPVCPEVELGLGVPREPIQLESDGKEVHLRGVQSRRDLTAEMIQFAERRVDILQQKNIAGYVAKSKSPSCALTSARVLGEEDSFGAGLFMRVLVRRMPHLPVLEESSLVDDAVRALFLENIFAQG
jgi:uncharacterized protein YbbK (DUF523 family)